MLTNAGNENFTEVEIEKNRVECQTFSCDGNSSEVRPLPKLVALCSDEDDGETTVTPNGQDDNERIIFPDLLDDTPDIFMSKEPETSASSGQERSKIIMV